MKLHGAIAYAFFYFSNVIRKRLRISEHIFLLLLIFALPTMVSCSRSDFQSNDNGVKLDEEPLVIFSFPGQKTSTLKLPRQKNLWAYSGSGSLPRLRNSAYLRFS